MEKLKKCPFCGGKGHIIVMDYKEKNDRKLHYSFQPICTNCTLSLGIFGTKQEAIEAWNTRAEEE